jgi:hypothetical protein
MTHRDLEVRTLLGGSLLFALAGLKKTTEGKQS